jgi:CheY-like chemotaxis protein
MPTQPGQEPGKPCRRVLIVEDDKDSREMLRILLELDGHDVHEAEDGPAAISAALALQPDVALVDVGLPGLDGHEVARQLRRGPAGERIVLVALTGYAAPEDRERSRKAGFDAHLTKPIGPEKLGELFSMLEAPPPHR